MKIHGFRIELGEVETQLARLESVDSALVLAKELVEVRQLVAYVKAHVKITESEKAEYVSTVKALLAQQLPEYMVPSALVVIEDWPLTPNGKVDKRALLNISKTITGKKYIAPSTETEWGIARIWSDILKIDIEKIGVTSTFFELGGNSILATKVVSQLDKLFIVDVTIKDVFRMQTIKDIAIHVDFLKLDGMDDSDEPVEEVEW